MNASQLDTIVELIGEQNVKECTKALADECLVWVFRSKEEALADPELTLEEKQFCVARFDAGEAWAGILRQQPRHIPGITIHPDYDTHGNYRGGGTGGSHGGPH